MRRGSRRGRGAGRPAWREQDPRWVNRKLEPARIRLKRDGPPMNLGELL